MALSIAEQDVPPIVLETDDTHVKAGFADEDVPRTISAAVAGNYFPMERGYIKEISHVELVWSDVFNYKLDADPAKHGVMLTEPILQPISNAKKIANSMFETYSVPYLGTAPGPVMALYASGRSNGCMLSVGGGLSQCIPVIDGYPVLAAAGSAVVQQTLNFGARDVTRYLGRSLMPHRGSWLHSMAEEAVMANVLETACFVPSTAEEYDEFQHNPVQSQDMYTMPDGLEFRSDKSASGLARPCSVPSWASRQPLSASWCPRQLRKQRVASRESSSAIWFWLAASR